MNHKRSNPMLNMLNPPFASRPDLLSLLRRYLAPFVATLLAVTMGGSATGQTLRLHPENPRWFQWRGETTALITSAEHYGAVLNLDFRYDEYLRTLNRDGMNYTRIFSGSYVEPQGAFGISGNTLAPATGRFLAPWARSDIPGYAGGGNKFDLEQFSPQYLDRLKAFVAAADKQNVVVELTLFCSTYSDKQWAIHPLNPANNVQAIPIDDWKKLNTAETPKAILDVQRNLTRWLVTELNEFDNLFFEIQNEPWSDNHTMGDFINPYLAGTKNWANSVQIATPSVIAWQKTIATEIEKAEQELPKKHLIGQNVGNFQMAVRTEDLVPQASVINFHYAYPEAVDWNRGLGRVIGYDETGFAGSADQTYRRQAWNFVLSGGALFNNLDYSFSVGHETGDDLDNEAPGGGSPILRRQLRILAEFLDQFRLEGLRPDRSVVTRASGVSFRCLGEPGRQYAIYLQGRSPAQLDLALPRGNYKVAWTDIITGGSLGEGQLQSDGEGTSVVSPVFMDGVALSILRTDPKTP